jgi:hypothetical protein
MVVRGGDHTTEFNGAVHAHGHLELYSHPQGHPTILQSAKVVVYNFPTSAPEKVKDGPPGGHVHQSLHVDAVLCLTVPILPGAYLKLFAKEDNPTQGVDLACALHIIKK